jgi:hypothetical protein
VRTANRINLEKARSVDKAIRYRPTEKRLAASRANLEKGRQSPNYKPYVRHGLRAVDLRQSAPLVGERQEEYDRHLQLVERVLPARYQEERNGVLGLAQALWRRRRVFVSRLHRETFCFYLELEKAALDGLCPVSVGDLGFATTDVFSEGEDPRLEQIMDRLDRRLVRVAEAYLSEQAEAVISLGVWGKHPYCADLLEQPPEVIGNGLVPPGVVKERMEKGREVDMEPADMFDWELKAAETKSGLLEEWMRLGYRLPDPRREEDFALHLRLIEAAFFGDRHAGFSLEPGTRKAGLGVWDSGFGTTKTEPRNPNPEFAVCSLEYRVAEFKGAFPKLYQAVWNLAEATWHRLQVFARPAEKETGELGERLEWAAAGTLVPAEKTLAQGWREARDRWLAQIPPDPIDEALWANIRVALAKAKAERQKSEPGSQEQEAGSQELEEGTGTPSEWRVDAESETVEFEIENLESQTEEHRIPNLREDIDEPEVQWVVEALLAPFLCSEAY